MPIEVLFVDEDALSRKTMRAHIENTADIIVSGEVENAQQALVYSIKRAPNVILVNLNASSPADFSGISEIGRKFPGSKIILISRDFPSDSMILETLRNGVYGCLSGEKTKPEAIIDAIRIVFKGGAVISPKTAGLVMDAMLTVKEGWKLLKKLEDD